MQLMLCPNKYFMHSDYKYQVEVDYKPWASRLSVLRPNCSKHYLIVQDMRLIPSKSLLDNLKVTIPYLDYGISHVHKSSLPLA